MQNVNKKLSWVLTIVVGAHSSPITFAGDGAVDFNKSDGTTPFHLITETTALILGERRRPLKIGIWAFIACLRR